MKQNRFKSKVVWGSILALIILILNNLGVLGFWGVTEETANYVVNTMLGILVSLGILNNPTRKDDF